MPAPIQIGDADWAELQRVLEQTLSQTEVWVFGSRARFDAKPYSDLDIAIVAAKPQTLEVLATLNDALDQSDLRIRVDVVDWATASDTFKAVINKAKILIRPAPAKQGQL